MDFPPLLAYCLPLPDPPGYQQYFFSFVIVSTHMCMHGAQGGVAGAYMLCHIYGGQMTMLGVSPYHLPCLKQAFLFVSP